MKRLIQTLFLTQMIAYSDDWYFPKRDTNYIHQVENIKIILNENTLNNSAYPKYISKIFRDSAFLFELKDLAFDRVYADSSNNWFLVVSNDGLKKSSIRYL